jgi:virginiamycin B lyase
VAEYRSPGGPNSQPYGITALNNVIWYVETGLEPDALVRFYPERAKFQTWTIPSGGGVVRNMMPTHDGNPVLACSGVNGHRAGRNQNRRDVIFSRRSIVRERR